jgi:hypothetical protein
MRLIVAHPLEQLIPDLRHTQALGPLRDVADVEASPLNLEHAGDVAQVLLGPPFWKYWSFRRMTSSGDANRASQSGPIARAFPRRLRLRSKSSSAGMMTSTFSPEAKWMMLKWRRWRTASRTASPPES